METHQQHLSMRDYGKAISKRWKVVAAFALLGLALGIYAYLTAAYAYQATSEVLIERPSGYVISASVGGLGTATSTKQQTHFLETEYYQRLGRALTELAPVVHLNLTDPATLDDVTTVIQTQVLNAEQVSPVRLVLYDLPSPSLLSFQQAKTISEAPSLGTDLRRLTTMAMGKSFSLTRGWILGRPGPSDRAIRDNIKVVASSNFVQGLRELGITASAAGDETAFNEDETEVFSLDGPLLTLAARTIGALADLEKVTRKDKDDEAKSGIWDLSTPEEVIKSAETIMTSDVIGELENGPGKLDLSTWDKLTPAEKLAKIQQAKEALWTRNRKHPQKQEAVWSVSGREVQDGADIIAINQVAPSPAQARLAANAMAAVMVWQDRMTKVAEAERSVRFLTQQLGTDRSGATKALRDKEDELTAFRKANRLLDADTQLKSAAEQAGNLEAQVGQTRASISESNAALNKTVQQLGGTTRFNIAPTIKQNPVIDNIKLDLIKTETELAGLTAQGYQDEWPELKNAKAQLENLQKRLSEEVLNTIEKQYTPDPVHFSLQQKAAELAADVVGLEARETAVQRLLGDMDGKFSTLPQKQADMVRLMRAQTLAERQYMDLYGRLIDAKNNRAMRQGNARVVAVALDPGKKVAPRLRNILAALLMGTFIGCLCALALSSTDSHIRSAEDVQRELKVPLLAHLPAFPAGDALVVESAPASAAAEALRSLRSTIRFLAHDEPMKTITATAVHSTAAKSALVANLSASLAQAGVTVTAVDADLRRPLLATVFGQSAAAGLSEALGSGQPASTFRQATRIPGLFLLPAGAVPANPAELLEGGRFAAALGELASGNDMVLIDTPPISAVSDAAIVSAATDALFVVIESGKTQPQEVRDAIAKLSHSSHARVLGVVIVGGDAPDARQYQRYAKTADTGSAPRGKA